MNDAGRTNTCMVEIKPGIFIEVKARKRSVVPFRDAQQVAASMDRRGKKYSRLLIEEAGKLADEIGLDAAVAKTGVKYWTIMQYRREQRRKAKTPKRQGAARRYTDDQKRACVALAHEIVRAGKGVRGTQDMSEAFAAAGQRLGMNGASIRWQWSQNMIPDLPSSHLHPRYRVGQ